MSGTAVSQLRARRIARGATVLALGLCFAAGCRKADDASKGDADNAAAGKRPNIILYVVDTLRYDHLSVYGYPRETTPALNAFARDAVTFETAYSSSAWTKPATASILTGLHPRHHGGVKRAHKMSDDVTLITERLKPLDYETIGFITNANTTATWGFDQGFDDFIDIHDRMNAIDADVVVDQVSKRLDAGIRQPFFMYVHTMDPHDPYDAPPPFHHKWPRKYDYKEISQFVREPGPPSLIPDITSAYDEEIAFGDAHFGRLMDKLKAEGLYDNSLIIFTADHGEEFRDHGGLLHGHSLFDELVRVPLLIKFPGNEFAGTFVRGNASLVDVVPTLLAALEVAMPPDLDGVDLTPLIQTPLEHVMDRPLFMDLDLERLGSPGEMLTAQAVVADGYKYIHMTWPSPGHYLFKLDDDPVERKNIAESEPEQLKTMQAMLAAFEAGATAGAHFRFRNAGDETLRTMTGTLRTNGSFVDLKLWQMEDEDRVTLSDDGKTINFTVALRNHMHLVTRENLFVVDEDQFSFSVDPPDAKIEIASLAADGFNRPPLYGGQDCKQIPVVPFTFTLADTEWWTNNLTQLLRKRGREPLSIPGGCYFAVVPPRELLEADISPELRARLKALGYMQ